MCIMIAITWFPGEGRGMHKGCLGTEEGSTLHMALVLSPLHGCLEIVCSHVDERLACDGITRCEQKSDHLHEEGG